MGASLQWVRESVTVAGQDRPSTLLDAGGLAFDSQKKRKTRWLAVNAILPRMKTKGADGECVDCFIGPHPESELVFVVDQCDRAGAFDEHKIMLGFQNEQEARAGYLSAYSKGWKCGPIKALTMPAFKKWLEEGHTGKAIEGQAIMLSTAHAPIGHGEANRFFIGGKGFLSGQFIPNAVLEKGSAEEKAQVVQKEPHELTRAEWIAAKQAQEASQRRPNAPALVEAMAKKSHEEAVKKAHKKGLVPEHVLAEYPQLKPKPLVKGTETQEAAPAAVLNPKPESLHPEPVDESLVEPEPAAEPGSMLLREYMQSKMPEIDAQVAKIKAAAEAIPDPKNRKAYFDREMHDLRQGYYAEFEKSKNDLARREEAEPVEPETAAATEEKPLAIGDAVHYDAGDGKIIETGIRHIKTSQWGKQTYTLYTGQKGVEAHDLTRIADEDDDDLDETDTDLESSDDTVLSKEEQEKLDNMTPEDVAEIRALLQPEAEDGLETSGEGRDRAGLPAEEPLGEDAAPLPAGEQAEPDRRADGAGGPGPVPASDDLGGTEAPGTAGGAGDAAAGGGGAGAGPPDAERGGAAGAVGSGSGESGHDGSGVETPAGKSVGEPATAENPTDVAGDNFRYTDRDFFAAGAKAKFKDNVAAIKTLRNIQAEGRAVATPAEQEAMSKFLGWGQFPALFNEYNTGGEKWDDERAELHSLISQAEYDSAEESINNAHYTHPSVVDAHWKIAEKLGFRAGDRFLETSAGIGYYLGMMPDNLKGNIKRTAVEKDLVSGAMLKLLYPQDNVLVQGFEEHKAPDGFYDLAASNVPFGDWSVSDPKYNRYQAKIHDYFFLKSADLVRPGGLVMHITSAGTMDKPDDKIRAELAKTCDLVSAIRFPGSTHQENAGTEVVTDMVILRKRLPGEAPGDQSWLKTGTMPDPDGGEPIPINQYFVDHPEQMLGTLDRTGTMYRGQQKNVTKGEDYEAQLQAAIDRLPAGIMKPVEHSAKAFEPESMPAPDDVLEAGYSVQKGKLYQRQGGALVEQTTNAKDLARIEGHLKILKAMRATINDQRMGKDATASRAALNAAYDEFVAKNGNLHDKANKRAFRGDTSNSAALLALENFDPKTKLATKADMFSKDTIRSVAQVSHAGTTGEALGVSLHETGGVDVDRMAQLTGKSRLEVVKDLVDKGIAYQDPSAGWKAAEIYLSGNVRKKLVLARAAAAADPTFQPNVDALEKVQPIDVDHAEIEARLGSSWIPPSDVADFAAHLLGGSADDFNINYVGPTASWQAGFTGKGERGVGNNKQATEVWSTPYTDFKGVLAHALNNTPMTVKGGMDERVNEDGTVTAFPAVGTDKNGDAIDILNRKETDAANAKVQEMREAFSSEGGGGWLWQDDERRERLHRHYNDNFNNMRTIHYNGQHQSFPGMNPAFVPHPHIKDFVWRVVTTGKGLAAHEVGTGKAQPLDAKVLTPAGWSRMGDLRIGDEVIAGDGTRTMVEGIFPQGEKDIFRVTFSDGASTECCDEHLWLTQTYHERNYAIAARHADKPKVRTLAEIRGTLIDPRLGGVKNHAIPVVGPVDFQAAPVPIDPYLLGVLLGDGSISQGQARISTEDDEIIERAAAALPATVMMREMACVDRCRGWSIVRPKQAGFGKNKLPNPFVETLAELGLVGRRSHDKFVPEVYKINEPSVRLGILQGLLDTDGTISARDNSVTFCSVSDRLADDVVFLVRSLGGIVSRGIKRPTFMYKGEKRRGRPCHRLCLSLPPGILPFRLKRKADLVVAKTKYKPTRYIVGVEPVGRKQAQCIRVAHPSHLYVTDDFAVTHNTAAMVMSAMELRRLGLAKKPCIACLKTNIEAIETEARKLYPGAKILSMAGVTDAKSRRKMMSQIATGDYDLVIMTHDNLDGLKMTAETQNKYIHEEMEELEAAKAASAAADPSKGNKVVKELNKAKQKLQTQLQNVLAKAKDEAVHFEDLGIDQMFIDEAHQYKSLKTFTKMERMKGIPTNRSDRAANMKMRAGWLMEHNGGRGMVFATGTPVSNTMAELYNMQRYLQPDMLKERGIEHFDAWASVFGEVQTKQEKKVTGEYDNVSRFSKFTNIPELMQIANSMMDVQRADDLIKRNPDGSPKLDADGQTQKQIVRPKREDHVTIAPNTDAMKGLMASLLKRGRELKGPPKKGGDNMLKICTDGRKGAIDMRLLDDHAPDDPKSKVNQCVANVLKIAAENPGKTQMIFSDIGVHPMKDKPKEVASDGDQAAALLKKIREVDDHPEPPDAEAEEGAELDAGDEGDSNTHFHLYGDIIAKLVKGGIPRAQIADFSQLEGAAKEAAMDGMRNGTVRVGVGGTKKMGTGVNVQDRLLALHHLDVPWVPAAIEQRNGRAHRHGNLNPKIDIHTYVTEGSLDEMMWQIVSAKAKFINQVINGESKERTIKDDDSTELSFDQLKAAASGDPRVMEKVQVDEDLRVLRSAESRHRREQAKFSDVVRKHEKSLPDVERHLKGIQEAAQHLEANPDFSVTIDGKTYDKRPEAAAALAAKDKAISAEEAATPTWRRRDDDYPEEEVLGKYRGMDIVKKKHARDMWLQAPSGARLPTGDTIGSMDYVARTAAKRHEQGVQELAKIKADTEKVRANIGKPFPKAARLKEVQEHAAALETAIGHKNAATQARHADRADAQDQADRMDQAERQSVAPPVAPVRHLDMSNDPDVQKIIEAGRSGDKTGANQMYVALRKKRKWSDEENEKMVAHIMGKIKEPVKEEPDDNPLALSQSAISISVREQVLLDLKAEVARLFPLAEYGAA
jgi:N12 class adenine-specific DNA methylase